jgi:hypothetical protein
MKDAWRSAEKYPLFEFLLVVPFVRVDLPHCMMDVSDRYLPCMPRIGCGVPEIAPADLTSAAASSPVVWRWPLQLLVGACTIDGRRPSRVPALWNVHGALH